MWGKPKLKVLRSGQCWEEEVLPSPPSPDRPGNWRCHGRRRAVVTQGCWLAVWKRQRPPASWYAQCLCSGAICPGKGLDGDFLKKLNDPGKKTLIFWHWGSFKEKLASQWITHSWCVPEDKPHSATCTTSLVSADCLKKKKIENPKPNKIPKLWRDRGVEGRGINRKDWQSADDYRSQVMGTWWAQDTSPSFFMGQFFTF